MKSEAPNIYILILNWNGKEDTLECLESVGRIDYPNYRTVVIDNGSSDDSVAVIKENFPQIHLIDNGTNLGFAEGNNVGIDYAISQGADYVFLLNNDTVIDPKALWAFVNASQKYPEAGMFGSLIYFYSDPNKIWFGGGKWLVNEGRFIHEGAGQIDDGKNWLEIKETDYVCGCALFVKAEVIKKIGMMEPKFFLMWEETDWCYRTKRAGYKCLMVPEAKVWHKISASFGGATSPHHEYFYWRNRLLWVERNIPFIEALNVYKIVLIEASALLRSYLSWRTNPKERPKKKAALKGIQDYFFRKFGKCPSWVISRNNH